MTDLLTLRAIHKSYPTVRGRVKVLQGVDLTVATGETLAIIGQSGSGKSTLLHICGLLDSPDAGHIRIAAQDIKNIGDREKSRLRNRHFGFVYQFHHLLPEFTALENVLMPVRIAGKVAEKHHARAVQLMHDIGLSHRHSHLPSQLSGGEQQRVAIARALMNHPKVLLADEPTGNLDPHTAEEVWALFRKMASKQGMALVMVTHNEKLAERCARQVFLQQGVLQRS